MSSIFVTGIHTDAGKTVVSAILCKALGYDYWKPVQSGSETDSDTETVKELIGDSPTHFFKEAYRFKAPLSPHTAAGMEDAEIDIHKIIRPVSPKLLIEGAGGLLVPLNRTNTIADLILPDDKVVLVSRHYLGSINHTLLSIYYLNRRGIIPGIIFVGNANPSTEDAILSPGQSTLLGRVDETDRPTRNFIESQGLKLKTKLDQWLMD